MMHYQGWIQQDSVITEHEEVNKRIHEPANILGNHAHKCISWFYTIYIWQNPQNVEMLEEEEETLKW